MTGDDPSDIEWLERDSREWITLTNAPDQMAARMTCTYLESHDIEVRVAPRQGRYCVEVPASQLEYALRFHTPNDSDISPPMQESGKKTGIHTGLMLRNSFQSPGKVVAPKKPLPAKEPYLMKWLLRLIVLGTLLALALLIFSD